MVILKRKSSEKDRVCRNMDSPNRAVDSKYSPVYFDDDDDGDDVTTKTLNGKSKSHKIKSEKAAKSPEISVKTPQHWPHSFVPGQISDHKDIEYKDLNVTQFVAGSCSILPHLLSISDSGVPNEVTYRLQHLKSLMCFAHSYPWDCILDIHHDVLIEIERGNRKWGNNFSDIESLNLLLQPKTISDSEPKHDKKNIGFVQVIKQLFVDPRDIRLLAFKWKNFNYEPFTCLLVSTDCDIISRWRLDSKYEQLFYQESPLRPVRAFTLMCKLVPAPPDAPAFCRLFKGSIIPIHASLLDRYFKRLLNAAKIANS